MLGYSRDLSPLWTAATGGDIESSPAVANGVVHVGSDDDNLYAFDAIGKTDCSGPLWKATTGGLVTSSPAIANGMLLVGSYDGNVYAYGLTRGTHGAPGPAI